MIAIFPELNQAAILGDLEQLAILARKYFAEAPTAPRLSVETLLLEAGIPVENLPMKELAALAAKDERGRFRIVAAVNTKVVGFEREFLLAHLLGHVLLDITPALATADKKHIGLRETVCPLARYTSETVFGSYPASEVDTKADMFAAALLLPKAMLHRASEKLPSQEQIAHFFGVSISLLETRQKSLTAQGKPANFIEAEKRLQTASHPTSVPKTKSHPPPTKEKPRGMARLREIAQRLDKR